MATVSMKFLRQKYLFYKQNRLKLKTIITNSVKFQILNLSQATKLVIPNCICFKGLFNENEKLQLIKAMKILDNFITKNEEESLVQELEPYLNTMKYESGHWDNAIKGFRETERLKWNSLNTHIIEKIKQVAFKHDTVPLEHVHVLDLEKNGVIMPHIDSVKFCGDTIAGLSLLSDCVMRLTHEKEKNKMLDVLLKKRSLYIMTSVARYNYTHEILGNENSKFGDEIVIKNRRISVICRNKS